VRNVRRHLPKDVATIVERRMRAAYRNPDPLAGQGDLEALAKELDRSHPGAAASCAKDWPRRSPSAASVSPPTLARTLRSTNAIESMIEICRDHAPT
jgi:putative transposase